MSEVNYIILRNSVEQAAWNALTTEQKANPANFQGHKFKVVEGGMQPVFEKAQTIETAIDGTADVSMGAVIYSVNYTIKLTQASNADMEANLGLYADLRAYFNLNNPNGDATHPSNLIHLVDHIGDEYDGFLIGTLVPQPVTTILMGGYAYYYIPISFRAKDAIA